MTTLTKMDSTKTRKRVALAALVFLGLSAILPALVRAQDGLLSQEGSATIDNQIQQGKYVIPKTFFGMHINTLSTPWPPQSEPFPIYFANQRLEGSDVNWWNIEVGPGTYDYNYLDQWIAQAQANKVTLMYTFDGVPQFYSSVPSDAGCTFEDGACDPPKDVNADGSGTDAAFIHFVTDLARHNAELGNPIQYWEMWNEPNQRRQWYPTCERLKNCYHNTSQCTGTYGTNLCYAQLLRMAADAYPIIKAYNPKAVILTPPPVGYPGSAELWVDQYLQWLKKGGVDCPPAGHCPLPDVISIHGYLNQWVMGDFPIPENEPKLIQQVKEAVRKNGFQHLPMWISEGGWGNIILDGFNDAVLQSAFLARYILLQESAGIPKAYWYQWDQSGGAGRLWQGPAADDLRLAGYAYSSVVNWTLGATLTNACAQQKGGIVWVCKYSRSTPRDYKAMIVWNSRGTSTFTLPQGFEQYCDLMGNVTPVRGKKVQIGVWPILLENKNLGQSACQQETVTLPEVAQSGISAALGRNIGDYHLQAANGGFHATNPHQNLAAHFAANGVEVRHGSSRWAMTLRSWGYGDALAKLEAVQPQASSNRVEYRRDCMTEWYVNGPVGLEQGFTLNQAPGKSNGQPLTIALTLSGDLTPSVDSGKKSLVLTNRQKHAVLRYTGLRAYDAAGQELSASLELRGQELRLHVTDGGARYPLTIDPITQEAKLIASNGQVNDQLGFSVAINATGDVAVVGAPNATGSSGVSNTGVAYVFVEPPKGWQGSMKEAAQLTASDGASGDQFGASVAIDGSTIVVGAPIAMVGSSPWQGAAYVFVQPKNGWTDASETAKLTALDGATSDQLGYAVAVSGNTVIAGAPFAAITNTRGVANYAQGAAYVYVEPSGGWSSMTQTSKFTTATGTVWSNFGKSVAINANTAVVGAPYYQLSANQLRGAAFVFVEPKPGWPLNMMPTARLLASDGATGDEFGYVAISGDSSTIVAGAPWNNALNAGKGGQEGAAYVFAEPQSGWVNMTQSAKLTASDGNRPNYFGNAVAISSDNSTIVVGAPNYRTVTPPKISEGAAYVFWEPSGGWAGCTGSCSNEAASATTGTAYDLFGTGMAVNNGIMMSGTPGGTPKGNNDYAQGDAYLFTATP